MVLTGIDMHFSTPPLRDRPGWYQLKAGIRKPDLFDIGLDGRINPDQYQLRLEQFTFNGQMGERQYKVFPPAVQRALRDHEVRGRLRLTARGSFPLNHLGDASARFQAELTEGHVAFENKVWPMQRIHFDATLARHVLAARYTADALGGQMAGDMNLGFDPPQTCRVTWEASGVRMEDTLSTLGSGPPKYSGLLSTSGEFTMNLHEGRRSLSGGGKIQVTDGQLIRLPIIRAVAEVLSTATLGLVPNRSDSAEAVFQLRPDRVDVDRLAVRSDPLTLQATGRITYDKNVDMRVTAHFAGNVTRDLGTNVGKVGEVATLGLLGKFSHQVGDAFGAVGDTLAVNERLVRYDVSGPLSSPRVRISGLGQ
jgi:hypothetical protein